MRLQLAILWIICCLSASLHAQEPTNDCRPLDPPELNGEPIGSVQYSRTILSTGTYPPGTVANFLCHGGGDRPLNSIALMPTTSRERRCRFDSTTTSFQWDGSQPFCQEIMCDPITIVNGEVSYLLRNQMTNNFVETTNANYRCSSTDEEIFELTGMSISVCSGNVERDVLLSVDWEPEPPMCIPSCLTLTPAFENGIERIDFPNDNRFENSTALYTCQEFLVPSSGLLRTCERFEGRLRWSLPEPMCVAACDDLIAPPNIMITYDQSEIPRPLATNAVHSCAEGYALQVGDELVASNSYTRTCVERFNFDVGYNTGNWNGEEPRCVLVCEDIVPLGEGIGSITYSSVIREEGSVANHTCLEGRSPFVPNGDLQRTCERVAGENRTDWSLPAETCRPICVDLTPLENGMLEYIPDGAREVGTVVEYSCNDGFIYTGGDENRTCEEIRENGVLVGADWSGSPGNCARPACPLIIPGEGIASIEYSSPGREVGSVARHSCIMPDYVPNGDLIRNCSDTGELEAMWDLPEETCRLVCMDLPDVMDGVIVYSRVTNINEIGTNATYICNEGFRYVNGDVVRICEGPGWSGNAGTCLPQCPPLNPLRNGSITYNMVLQGGAYDLNTQAIHTCNFGFELVGVVIRNCTSSGVWTDNPPTCEPYMCSENSLFIANGAIQYSMPGVSGSFPLGTVATFSCNSGFCITPGEVVCQVPGVWVGNVAVCQRIACPNFTLPRAVVTHFSAGREEGTQGSVMCEPPLIPTDIITITCIEDTSDPEMCTTVGIWSPDEPLPECTEAPTEQKNYTATGDPLMTIPICPGDRSVIPGLNDSDTLNLCFEIHGVSDRFFNLVTDSCINVNAHYNLVLPDNPVEDINVIDRLLVRAVGNDDSCRNIEVSLADDGTCLALVDGASINSMFQSSGISVRVYSNRVRIGVPNCNMDALVMWVFCTRNTFWSASRVDEFGNELEFDANMIKFVIARGVGLQETSHGIIGQFWNVPVEVLPFSGSVRESSLSVDTLYEIGVSHPNQQRNFTGWLYPLTWEFRAEYCLYSGNQQGGPIFEVMNPNDPVIEGEFPDYIVDTAFGTSFRFGVFEESRCQN